MSSVFLYDDGFSFGVFPCVCLYDDGFSFGVFPCVYLGVWMSLCPYLLACPTPGSWLSVVGRRDVVWMCSRSSECLESVCLGLCLDGSVVRMYAISARSGWLDGAPPSSIAYLESRRRKPFAARHCLTRQTASGEIHHKYHEYHDTLAWKSNHQHLRRILP